MFRTEKQGQQARENGAKSQGPATPQGKAASSKNSITHGLCARDVVLSNEDPEAWEELRTAFHQRWRPADQVEATLVDELAATQWKLYRAESIETAMLNIEMDILEPEMERSFTNIEESARQALAFKSLADQSKFLAAIERHQTRLGRQFQRTYKQLTELQNARPKPEPEPEPEPQAVQPDAVPVDARPGPKPVPALAANNTDNSADQPRRDDGAPPCRAA